MARNLAQILDLVRDKCRFRHLSINTERTYCFWVRKFGHAKLSYPADWSPERMMEAFLSAEARRGVSASTQNQAFNALLFLYREVLKVDLGNISALRAKRPAHIRHAPSHDEVRALLSAVGNQGGYPTRLITHLLYGCGLRVTEPLNLRIKDIRLSDSKLIIRGAKGGKDRVVSIPCSLVDGIKKQIERARAQWQMDSDARLPVAIPGQLAHKYPNAPFSWQWYWLFPAHNPCRHPRTGESVRWRCHEANVQRAVKAAAAQCDLGCVVTPHNLRHAYATHAMEAGAMIRDVQECLGHAHLETTMRYLHAEAGRVASPLDTL